MFVLLELSCSRTLQKDIIGDLASLGDQKRFSHYSGTRIRRVTNIRELSYFGKCFRANEVLPFVCHCCRQRTSTLWSINILRLDVNQETILFNRHNDTTKKSVTQHPQLNEELQHCRALILIQTNTFASTRHTIYVVLC